MKPILPVLAATVVLLHCWFWPPVAGAADSALRATTAQPGSVNMIAMNDSYADDEYDDDENSDSGMVADPLLHWNTVWYHFNDKLYFWLMKPVARGYKAILPAGARLGVSNFFHNLTTPIRLTNCLLQGKAKAAGHELGRFVLNTSFGVLGIGDVAIDLYGLTSQDEDFGQTLGHHGMGNGVYIVWPFFGPSTVRDSIGLVGDYFLDPVSYLDNFSARLALRATDRVNAISLVLGDYEAMKEAALDPYVSMRNAYIQHRTTKISE